MKRCKDCRWRDGEFCNAPKNVTVDPIYGGVTRKWEFCSTHRTGSSIGFVMCRLLKLCGKEGRWYEAK